MTTILSPSYYYELISKFCLCSFYFPFGKFQWLNFFSQICYYNSSLITQKRKEKKFNCQYKKKKNQSLINLLYIIFLIRDHTIGVLQSLSQFFIFRQLRPKHYCVLKTYKLSILSIITKHYFVINFYTVLSLGFYIISYLYQDHCNQTQPESIVHRNTRSTKILLDQHHAYYAIFNFSCVYPFIF